MSLFKVDIDEFYLGAISNMGKHSEALFKNLDAKTAFSKAHNFAGTLETLLSAVSGRPEFEILRLAINEYSYALLSAASGNYRHAHSSLRLFLELSLSSLQFSANELKLRRWLKGEEDVNWNSIIDTDNGIFSKYYIQSFTEGLDDFGKQHLEIAAAVYRECSEYVHGNHYTHAENNEVQNFNFESLENWIDRAESANLAFIFAYAARYMGTCSQVFRNKVEAVMLEHLGTLTPIQAMYSE